MLPTKILLCSKMDLDIGMNNTGVNEHKKKTQSSPVLPSQNGRNSIDNENETANTMTRKSEDKNETSQMKHSPQDTPYFIPDPTNPDNLLGPMTKADLDLFHESRHKPMDIVDEAIFDQISGLYYLLWNKSHNDRTAFPTAIYHLMTETTYCYDKQLKQLFFVCPSYCPTNTMYIISNEPDIPHYVSNTIGIPYPPVPSLAQAADIPPSLMRLSPNSSDAQTTPPMWPDHKFIPDTRWDNPTFMTFNPGNSDNNKTQPNAEPPKPTEIWMMSSQNDENMRSNRTNNLLLQLGEKHPRF